MSFDNCPSFIPAVHIMVERLEEGVNAVTFEGEDIEVDAAQLNEAFEIDVDAYGNGTYALPHPGDGKKRFRADWAANVVTFEGDNHEEEMDAQDFAMQALRTNRDGRPICSMMQLVHVQHQLCREAEGGELHLPDIKAMVEAYRDEESQSLMQRSINLLDIDLSGINDGKTVLDMMMRPEGAKTVTPVHEYSPIAEAVRGRWHAVKDYPQFQMGSVRALLDRFMNGYLNDFPIGEVSRIEVDPAEPIGEALNGIANLISVDDPISADEILPGYRTSAVYRYEGEDFEAIAFSDRFSSYVYAWPKAPAPEHRPLAP